MTFPPLRLTYSPRAVEPSGESPQAFRAVSLDELFNALATSL
ncbi:hypothetical protein [Streptomyces pseudogriseolus]|nr:hypothetical protein [Streptomyces pseudogriseolus]